MNNPLLICLILSSLLATGCDQSGSEGATVIVISQIKLYTSENDPPTTGVKFYHLINRGAYQTARVIEVASGASKELARYAFDEEWPHDVYLTLSFYPERGDRSWWAWCDKSGGSQVPFLQGPIDKSWELDSTSSNGKISLNGAQCLIDTVIFTALGTQLDTDDYHQIRDSGSIQELEDLTTNLQGVRLVALVIDDAQQDEAFKP